jgi:hypothetical protein
MLRSTFPSPDGVARAAKELRAAVILMRANARWWLPRRPLVAIGQTLSTKLPLWFDHTQLDIGLTDDVSAELKELVAKKRVFPLEGFELLKQWR